MRRSDQKRSKHDNIPGNKSRLFNTSSSANIPYDGHRQFYNPSTDCPEPSAPPESDNNPVSSEYTPLLENFTERFINRSQGPVPGSIVDTTSVSSTITTSTATNNNLAPQQSVTVIPSPVVPPELLLIHYQQSPFNPNLVASDISSLSSYSNGDDDAQNDHNQPRSRMVGISDGCYSKFRLYCCQTFWYLSQTILILSLIVYNFGSTFVPSIYSSLVITPNFVHANTSHSQMVTFDFFALTTVQFTMSLLALIGSLILLYSASRVIHRLSRRVHLRNLKQISRSATSNFAQLFSSTAVSTNETISDSESTTTIITSEMIIFETLGSTMARIFSLIMLIHQFCICSMYIHLIYDYFDMIILSSESILSSDWINYLGINSDRKWYLDHLVLGSIWLTLMVSIIVALATTSFIWSRRQQDWQTIQFTRLYLLWILKILAIMIGFITIIILPFVGIHIYLRQNLQMNKKIQLNKSIANQSSIGHIPNPFPPFDLCMNDWYASLFGAIPILLMPFHLNEILIMLMYSRYDYQYYRRRLQIFDNGEEFGQNDNNSEQQRHLLISDQQHAMNSNYQSIRYPDASVSRSSPIITEESGDPLLYLASMQSMKRSSVSSFFFRSYSSIRNWFIMIAFFILLFQVFMNIFYFHPIDTKIINSTVIELNFIRSYLNEKSIYVMVASIVFLLNATILYLLMLFRGKLALDWLRYGQKYGQKSVFVTRFNFWTPYIIWNCLALIISLALEYLQRFLQIQIWLLGLTTLIILLLYPSMLLMYFAAKTLRSSTLNNTTNNTNRQESISQRFRPLRWPWFFLFISIFLFSTTMTYLIFWIYGFWYDEKDFGYFIRIQHQ